MTAVPRPMRKLSDEQRRLLQEAVQLAHAYQELRRRADEKLGQAWAAILAARDADVADEVLCDETGFSRSTLNRKYGPRRAAES